MNNPFLVLIPQQPLINNNMWYHYPKLDMNKFDGSDPSSWVT